MELGCSAWREGRKEGREGQRGKEGSSSVLPEPVHSGEQFEESENSKFESHLSIYDECLFVKVGR